MKVGPAYLRLARRNKNAARTSRPEFLDCLADLVPPPRKHRHRYHGVFAPNHKLRPAGADPRFAARLEAAGFAVEIVKARTRPTGGSWNTISLGTRS